MYKRETKEIGRLFEVTMLKKFGPAELSQHYAEFDTICDATQERQDAVTDMVAQKDIDFILVVGGFDSSNTAHLKEIPEKFGTYFSYLLFQNTKFTVFYIYIYIYIGGNWFCVLLHLQTHPTT